MNANELKIVNKSIADLKPADYNPKKLSAKQAAEIKQSIIKFGVVDPIIVNVHPDRKNIIIGGHQRVKVLKQMGYDEVPCIELILTLEQERELNVRLSKNTGSFDEDLLKEFFDKDFLLSVGFEENELKMFKTELEEEFNETDNSNCAYPIVPKFNEKYDCAIIIATNETDCTFLETVLGITKSQSYKNSRVGKSMVITVDQFKEALKL